jgi:hypothetical protein
MKSLLVLAGFTVLTFSGSVDATVIAIDLTTAILSNDVLPAGSIPGHVGNVSPDTLTLISGRQDLGCLLQALICVSLCHARPWTHFHLPVRITLVRTNQVQLQARAISTSELTFGRIPLTTDWIYLQGPVSRCPIFHSCRTEFRSEA